MPVGTRVGLCDEADKNWYDEEGAWDYRTHAIKSWLKGKDNPKWLKFGFHMAYETGHFTQMVWKGSTSVGFGVAFKKVGMGNYKSIVVARFSPPGNMRGAYAQNVMPLKGKKDEFVPASEKVL